MKLCGTCGQEKPLAMFHARGGNVRGQCKVCVALYGRRHRVAKGLVLSPDERERRLVASRIKAFWSRVDRSGGDDACWPWTGAVGAKGYGSDLQHRKAYALAHGAVPAGLCVCHRCDNPPCCNPAHLFIGTVGDNNADKVAKGRHSHGDTHGKSILTADDVRSCRERHASGVATYSDLAREFGVQRQCIRKACVGLRWASVT